MNTKLQKMDDAAASSLQPWQQHLHTIIFEADTTAGKIFDVALFVAIGISIAIVMLESCLPAAGAPASSGIIDGGWARPLILVEWVLTALFTIEYVLRILCVAKPLRYVTSFFGVIDLLAILPSYLGLFLGPQSRASSLSVIRGLRLLRVFRVLKLAQYLREARTLLTSLRRSGAKITVFFAFMIILVLILGSAMYWIEAEANPEHFSSIPKSVYWAIVTVTTVGYGDIVPKTVVGQALAALAMILGYSVIVVPTGIVTADIFAEAGTSAAACPGCAAEGHDGDAVFCKKCGTKL